jgi:hypothetical protein
VNAIANDDENAGRGVRAMIVGGMIVSIMMMAMITVRAVTTVGVTLPYVGPVLMRMSRLILPVPVGMRVPPEHELLNDKKDPQSDQQCHANAARAPRSNTFNGIRKERQQRRTQQSAGRITDEVRQQPPPGGFRDQQKQSGERRAGDPADRGEKDDPGEQGQRLCASCRTKLIRIARASRWLTPARSALPSARSDHRA